MSIQTQMQEVTRMYVRYWIKMQDTDEILGSRQERSTESLVGYEQVKDYKHGDIGSMKKILMKLHTL